MKESQNYRAWKKAGKWAKEKAPQIGFAAGLGAGYLAENYLFSDNNSRITEYLARGLPPVAGFLAGYRIKHRKHIWR